MDGRGAADERLEIASAAGAPTGAIASARWAGVGPVRR
jgi:hypothetical protein